jgi:hypothetical protein
MLYQRFLFKYCFVVLPRVPLKASLPHFLHTNPDFTHARINDLVVGSIVFGSQKKVGKSCTLGLNGPLPKQSLMYRVILGNIFKSSCGKLQC